MKHLFTALLSMTTTLIVNSWATSPPCATTFATLCGKQTLADKTLTTPKIDTIQVTSNGTVGAPTYSWSASPTSGMYRVTGSENVHLSTNSTDGVVVDASQNVTLGSGTSNIHTINAATGTGSTTMDLGTTSPCAFATTIWMKFKLNGTTSYIPVCQ